MRCHKTPKPRRNAPFLAVEIRCDPVEFARQGSGPPSREPAREVWMKLRASTAALAAMFGLAFTAPAVAQQAPPDHPGRGVYNKTCATCHDKPVDPRAATLASIQQQTPARLREIL